MLAAQHRHCDWRAEANRVVRNHREGWKGSSSQSHERHHKGFDLDVWGAGVGGQLAWSDWHLEEAIFTSKNKRNLNGVREFGGYRVVML